jgi:cobalt-zinc-cadmium efflux system membrane fusion protein
MNQKSNKIAICFLAAAILAGATYMFLNFMRSADSLEEETEKDPGLLITMTPEQIQEEKIVIRPAGPAQLQNHIYAPGQIVLSSNQLMHIVPKVSGIVKEARKNIGDPVLKGEILVILDSQEMAEAKSAFLDKLQKKRQAEANLARETKLRDKNISSEQDLQNRQSEMDQIEIELELAKQKLHTMELASREIDQLEQTKTPIRQYELRSPLSGTIIDKKLIKGELLRIDDEVYVIADLSAVAAELSLFPYDIGSIAEGLEIDMTCPYGNKCKGTIVSISPVIDPDTRTITATALIENPDKMWKPGTYVSAAIKTQAEQVPLAVLTAAIQKIDNEDCVFVANEKGFEIRPIKRGRSDEYQVEILSGLSPNELYASTNTFILKAEHGKDEAQHMD